jgi:hypothetical protein
VRPAPSLTLACETVPELTPPCEVGRCLLRSSKHAARSVLLSQVAVGQRNGLVEKPQTRAGRLKTEVV